jgi:DNA-binding LacI/PurR family transcriptional regulator
VTGIADVARAAGVSVATVSRVLAGTSYPVRPATRWRVEQAVEQLQYRPNGLGRSLRVGRSSAVGVCATTLNNPTAVAAVEGIIRACRAVNRHVQTTTTFSDPDEERGYLDLFLQERVAGVISFPAGAPPVAYQRLQDTGAPVVLLNRPVPGLAAPRVCHDFAGGYALAAQYLAGRGHRRIGAIMPPNRGLWAEQTAAWHQALEQAGLEPDPALACHVDASTPTDATYADIRQLLERDDPPTALFAATATSTLVALRVVQTADVFSVRAVELVGTGDRRWELLFPPTVPFICLDSFGLGTTAARLLNEMIDGDRALGDDTETQIAVSFVRAAVDRAPGRE